MRLSWMLLRLCKMLEISVLLFVWYVWLDSIDKFLKFVG